MNPAWRQGTAQVRFDWGPTGATAVADGAAYAVIVDVLSFTTCVTVAAERSIAVFPYRWGDSGAEEYAAAHDAVLAVGRSRAEGNHEVSLSPASIVSADPGGRLVLPSPNGSALSAQLAGSAATVVAASLRNADAVAEWLAAKLEPGQAVAVIAAGERWPDGSLRPAAEDLWGAGAVISGLLRRGLGLAEEARVAGAAYDAVRHDVAAALRGCASGRELLAREFAQDVAIAAKIDATRMVPVLVDGAFGSITA